MFGVSVRVKGSFEAAKLYCGAFGLTLGYHVLNPDGNGYYHSELQRDGKTWIAVLEAPESPAGNPVELDFTFTTKEELVRAFELLKEGGQVTLDICELPWSPCAAMVTDRFGVNWYLTLPGYRPPEDFKPEDC